MTLRPARTRTSRTSWSSGASSATKTASWSKAPSGTSTWKCRFNRRADPKRCTKVIAPQCGCTSGPVFFKQRRVGLHGAHFDMLKFRSMVMNADAMKDKLMAQNEMQGGVVFKMKNDPRITAIGRFIRKFSIDELPQLINILRGDMTIVGPRPAVPREVALYKVWQRRRLSVRPGLTCYWQVGGRNEIGFDEWMQLDLRYVDNWNLKIDVELILKTIPVVVTGRGAS